KGHIPGSKNVLMSQFDPENKRLAAAKGLPVVLVCKTGQSAGEAAKRLKKAGFERVFVLDGGIGGWLQADLPLAKGRGRVSKCDNRPLSDPDTGAAPGRPTKPSMAAPSPRSSPPARSAASRRSTSRTSRSSRPRRRWCSTSRPSRRST